MKKPYCIFNLGPEHTPIENFETLPGDRHMGYKELPDKSINKNHVKIIIGDKPTALKLSNRIISEMKDIDIPEISKSEFIFEYYDLWLITHSIAISRDWGRQDVLQVGYEMEFLNTDNSDILVLSVLPKTEYIQKIGGKFLLKAGLRLNGDICNPIEEILKSIKIIDSVELSFSSEIILNFSFSVNTSKISSVGEQSTYSKWFFRKCDDPLIGDDIKMYQLILSEKRLKEIQFKARVSAILPTWQFMLTGRQSEWANLSCTLIDREI